MWRKIIDNYRLQNLNDLFEIKLIFYGLSRMLQFFSICMAAKLFGIRRLEQFSPYDATDRIKISSDQQRFLSH